MPRGVPNKKANGNDQPMKAWRVDEGGEFPECCLLVYAETRNKAKVTAIAAGLWEYEYAGMRAIRAPEWDWDYYGPRVIETNDALPPEATPFYDDTI